LFLISLCPGPLSGAVEAMRETLSRWGKSWGETTKMVESLSRDTWQHCEISAPLLSDNVLFSFERSIVLVSSHDSFLEVHGLVGCTSFLTIEGKNLHI
jgi:hypothetical protein